MTGSKLLDSSVWLEYFLNGSFQEIIEGNETLLISALSLFEVKKKLVKSSLPLNAKFHHSLSGGLLRKPLIDYVELACSRTGMMLRHHTLSL